ncbi:MAG: O-antigen ligase family protein [Planctomycetaceae bacterium]|nr:O-antigen ligase family protein [Planctomycetaceae bacterium]
MSESTSLARASRSEARAWFGAFLVAVCYGNVYVGVTLPAALFLLPFIAWRCPPPVSPPTVTWLMVACGVTPIAQWMLGHGPTTRSDFIEYFPIFYTALVAWGLGGLVIDAEDVVTPLLGGAALIAVLMVGHMIMYPPRIFAFYLVKATAATPLGRSNYLAVFFLIALNVALYANAPWARRAVVPLCLAIGLSLARIGSGFAVLSLLMWLRFVGVERRSTGLVVSGFAACAIPILVVGGLSAQPPSLERGDSLADIAAYHDQESIASLESISVRGELWSDAVDAFLAYPLFGVPKSVWSKVGEQVVVGGAHSSILTSLSGRGLWGTFVFGCFVVTMLRVVGCRRSKSPTWRGLSIALVMTLIWSLIEPILFTPAYACLTTALVSVTAFSGKHAVELRLAGTCARVAA